MPDQQAMRDYVQGRLAGTVAPPAPPDANPMARYVMGQGAGNTTAMPAQMLPHPYDLVPLFAGPSDMPPPAPPPPADPRSLWLQNLIGKVLQPQFGTDPKMEVQPPDPKDYWDDRQRWNGQALPRPWTAT
jgi:hypothetical protein